MEVLDFETVTQEFCAENYIYYELPQQAAAYPSPRRKRRSHGATVFSELLFYGCLVVILLGVFIYTQSNAANTRFMGFTFYRVLTTSMQSVYPQGSLVVTRVGNKDAIEVGDDITFMISPTESATHRCIEVIDNYNESGMRAYRTQGVDNPAPDKGVVFDNNVIGRVVWSVPAMGNIMAFVAANMVLIAVFFFSLMLLSFGIRILWGESAPARDKRKMQRALKLQKRQYSQAIS